MNRRIFTIYAIPNLTRKRNVEYLRILDRFNACMMDFDSGNNLIDDLDLTNYYVCCYLNYSVTKVVLE